MRSLTAAEACMSEQDYEPTQDDAPQRPRSRAVVVGTLTFLALVVLIAGFDMWQGW
jgi:hypothetical protein